jgi:class 3 adenylate cyclase
LASRPLMGSSPDALGPAIGQAGAMSKASRASAVANGTFLIADISGYTQYLAGADLDHAPAIATDLLTRVIDAIGVHFSVNKVEGDAVFSYSFEPSLTGSQLLDVVDGTYASFRRRLLSVGEATSCGCPACGMVPGLDLKVIAHTGVFSRQHIAGRAELVGKDVIIAHRLLKNNLGFAGVASGYLLLTDSCAQSLGIDPTVAGMTPHSEHYPHLGEIRGWVANLQKRVNDRPKWKSKSAAFYESRYLMAGTAADVWNALAPGRSDTCVTSRLSTIHEVIEWTPFERLVVEVKADEANLLHEVTLVQRGDETLATVRWYRGRRRPNAPSWKEIESRLAQITSASLDETRDRFARAG